MFVDYEVKNWPTYFLMQCSYNSFSI